jgi:hypothetical protein
MATEIGVRIGVLENGNYVAVSLSSPFFCFEAQTRAEVEQSVETALAFYRRAKDSQRETPPRSKPETRTVTRLRPTATLRKALAAA